MFVFTVTPDVGDPYEVESKSRDTIRWERTGPGRSLAKLLGDMHFSDLSEICYYAAKREGHTTAANLAEFENSVDFDFESVAADPTRKPASVTP